MLFLELELMTSFNVMLTGGNILLSQITQYFSLSFIYSTWIVDLIVRISCYIVYLKLSEQSNN